MSDCCISGCHSLRSQSTKIKFFRIPTRHQPRRRLLWIQAIQQTNGSAEELRGDARVCGAHFISGAASTDPNSPDFSPSVFTSSAEKPRKKTKRLFGWRRRRRHLKAKLRQEEIKSPSQADSPVEDEESVLMETESEFSQEIQMPSSPLVPKEQETFTPKTEAEIGATTIKPSTPSPTRTSLSINVSECLLNLDRMNPVVRLKRIVVPEDGPQSDPCSKDEEDKLSGETCGMSYNGGINFSKHHCAKPEVPSFPCNICGRFFPTIQYLKRHKLLHIRDSRRCPTCGVLFCRRHNHIFFPPIAKVQYESEGESSVSEPEVEESHLKSKELETPEQSQTYNKEEGSHVFVIITPFTINESTTPNPKRLPGTLRALLPQPDKEVPETPTPQLENPTPLPALFTTTESITPNPKPLPGTPRVQPPPPTCRPPLLQRYQDNLDTLELRPLPPGCPEGFLRHPKRSTSLKVFSPQHLTSALLEVHRNYEYILSTPTFLKKEPPEQPPVCSQNQRAMDNVKMERIAYEIEIEI